MVVMTDESNVAVIDPGKHIDITTVHELKEQLATLYKGGVREIVFDFTNVERIDCSGLGKLLLTHRRLQEASGGVRIVNVNNSSVRNFFELAKLETVIPFS